MNITKKDIVLVSVIVSTLVVGGYWYETINDRKKPDYQAMRKYRISLMSDDAIRQMKLDAHTESIVREEQFQHSEDLRLKKRNETLLQCNDVAFQLKNEDECNRAKRIDINVDMRLPGNTESEIFESKLIGECVYAQTVAQAKDFGCLPK